MVEHKEACNAREIGRAEKKRTESSRRQAYPERRVLVLPHTRLRAIDAFAWLEKACGMGKATFMCDKPSEKLVEAFKFQVVDREGRKEVALPPLGTSKINSS